MSRSFTLIGCLLLLAIGSASGTKLYVGVGGTSTACTTSANPCGNMGAALAVAVSGDEVVLLPGLHGPTSNSKLVIDTPIQLTITGSGQGATIVDLQNQGRFMKVDNRASVTLRHLTVRNGNSNMDAGGAFLVLGYSSLTLEYVNTEHCMVEVGGGWTVGGGTLWSSDSAIVMRHMVVSDSSAPVGGAYFLQGMTNATMVNVTTLRAQCLIQGCFGGGLVPEGSTRLTIADSAFIECYAPQGFGGAIDDGSTANWTVSNTLFLRNHATYGGAVYNYGQASSYYYNCQFIDNVAENNGGGTKPSSNTFVHYENCLFQNNSAASNAGTGPASDCSARGNMPYCAVFKHCIFRANKAASIAGGMAITSNTWIENTTFVDNWSLDIAGGLYLYLPVNVYISDLTFINNVAPNGAGLLCEGDVGFDFLGTTTFINNTARYIQLAGAPSGIGANIYAFGQVRLAFHGPVSISGGGAAMGGGIAATGNSKILFYDTVLFQRNHAVNGAGLYLTSSANVTFVKSTTFEENSAITNGGGIYQDGASILFAKASIQFLRNSARFGGGYSSGPALIYCPAMNNSNFDSNTASGSGGGSFIAITHAICVCSGCTHNGNTAPNGATFASGPASVAPTAAIPQSVSASEEFSASFVLNNVYGEQAAAQDRVVTVTVQSWTLPDGTTSSTTTGSGSKRAGEASQPGVTLRGPDVAYFAANVASFGVLKLSGPPGSSAVLVFDASPSVDRPYTISMTISPCSEGFVGKEIDGTHYCLKANRISTATHIAIPIVAGLCIVFALIILFWFVYYRNKAAIRKSSVLFCILTTIGAIFLFACAIMWVFVSNGTCVLRVWLLVIGFVLCYGSIFVKEYRLWRIFDETDITRPVRVSDGLLLKVVFGALAVELIIALAWFIYTPFMSREIINLSTEEVAYLCTSTKTPAFFWVLFALNMLILLVGCILAWLARNVPANFNEAKQILFCIYNVTLIAIIVITLSMVFRKTSEAVALTVSIGLIFSSFITLLFLWIPKIRHVANKDAVRRSINKEIAKLERDISWKKRLLQEVDSVNSVNSRTVSMNSARSNSQRDQPPKERSRRERSSKENADNESVERERPRRPKKSRTETVSPR